MPPQVRESAYGLGATTGEVVMKVPLPYVRRGAIGAVMLGLGRALGETMAVTFIIGNAHGFPKGLFDAGSTIASTIANEFNEASGLQSAALIALGLVLFLITSSFWRWRGCCCARRRSEAMAVSTARIASRRISSIFVTFCVAVTVIALTALALILFSLVSQGLAALGPDLFTIHAGRGRPRGGLINAIVGSIMMSGLGMVIALIVGILAGTWLAEFAGDSPYGGAVRFLNDVLLSSPSILIGLFVYEILVAPFKGFGLRRAVALAFLAAPVITRTTEDVLKLQPTALREVGRGSGVGRCGMSSVRSSGGPAEWHPHRRPPGLRPHQR